MTRRKGQLPGLAALLCPLTASASDYSGLPVLLYGATLIASVVVFAIVWALTRPIRRRWLRTLPLCLAATAFWAPIDLGAGSHTARWPVSCFFLAPEQASEAPVSVLVTTLLLWCFVLCLPRASANTTSP